MNMAGADSRKRKLGDVEGADPTDGKASTKRRKVMQEGFLDCGSVSWSFLLASFFLSLHKGTSSSSDSEEKFCMTYASCIEMLEVLANEFGDMIPLETSSHVLSAQGPGSLVQLRENSLI